MHIFSLGAESKILSNFNT